MAVNAQAGGEPKQYKKIIGELSGALVKALDLGGEAAAEVEPEPAPEAEEIDNEAADVFLASFSRAMDAVDKNDVREAKKNLQQVQKIDKTNEAAKYYLNKLQALSPKFRVEMVEVWPLHFLSIRGGYEYSHLSLNGEFKLAHGVVGGLTLKIWKFDINANLTYRQKPARLLPGADVSNMKLLIGIEFRPDWMDRK